MTIPTRPAPPPPIYSVSSTSSHQRSNGGGNVQKLLIKLPPPTNKPLTQSTTASSHSITRNFPKAKINTEPLDPFEVPLNRKGPAPPRPPPPKTASSLLKKPNAPPTSVNIVSNLFGKKKAKPTIAAKPDIKQSKSNNISSSHINPMFATFKTPSPASEFELIQFDTPSPSSPTFTQKSNSDCVSVDSFSSDSNFSSPNNGHGSQPESGFEDDFSTSRATTSPADPWDTLQEVFSNAKENIYSNSTTAPVRNFDIVSSRVQPENILCNGKNLIPPTPALAMPTIIKPKISQKPKAPKPPAFKSSVATFASDDLDPPMPSFAPPPPPPGVFILQSVKEAGEPYGIALYDFQSIQEGDLPFRENEKIYLLSRINEEWFYGKNKSGCEGMFPSNYIDVRVPLLETTSPSIHDSVSVSSQPAGEKIRALYTFLAQEEGDLTFYENDIVTVLSRINEDWLFGEVDSGRSGQFPSNYLEYQPKNI